MKIKKIYKIFDKLLTNTKRLLRLAWETDKKLMSTYYLTAALGAITPVAISISLRYLIDYLQIAQGALTTNIPTTIIVALAAYYLMSILLDVIYYGFNHAYLDYLLRYKLQNEVSYRFHKKLVNLDIAHFEDTDTQDLLTKTRETMQWRVPDNFRYLRDLFSNMVTYISALIVLVNFGWWIPILITVITIPRIYLRAKHGAIQWSIYGSGAPEARKLWYYGWLLQNQKAIQEMRIFQSAKAVLKRYKDIQNYLYELNKKPVDRYLKVRNFPTVIELSILFVIAYSFVPDVIAGTITIGTFTLIVNMMSQLNSNAASAATKIGELYENSLYVEHFFDTTELPKLIKDEEDPIILTGENPPLIEFKDVNFSYPKGPKVLSDISFTIEPGESVAFVGHNGAGKSTIIKLLCRFYDSTEGKVLINKIDIKKLEINSWYKYLGTLFQEFTQYHFKVSDNITLGSPHKDDKSLMVEAAKKSGAHEFITKLSDGYDTQLGREFEDGKELSVGQWQKLAIARAFYEEPPVLILDEPTSAIDAETEYDIFNNLQSQYTNKTLILVSHRFSTVRNANKIFVLDKGKIIERGTHNELMQLKGRYHKMFTVQAKGYI